MKRKFKRMFAGTMIAVLGLQGAGCGKIPSESGMGNVAAAAALVTAEYPEMAKYPDTNGFDWNEEKFQAWIASRREQEPENTEYQQGIREFSEATIQEFLKDTEGKNKVYSPLNVYMALAMLAETTDGESRQQILDLLHTDSIETLRNHASTLWNANYCDDGTVTSLLASSIWLADNFFYNKTTLETLAECYYASSFRGEMGSKEYTKLLQNWLDEQTGGLLKEQAGTVELRPETILALATTVYFRAKWADEFYKENNTEEIFHAPSGDIKTEFMHQSGTNMYYWGENFGAISRPLENSGQMLLLLPDEDVSAEALLTDSEVLDFIYDYSTWENREALTVNQAVPKFDAASECSLIEGLKNLGVTDVFDSATSDFTPLVADGQKGAEEIAVSEATHAARVMIDEEGCVAAAFTVIMANKAMMPPEKTIDFVLDRPFLFVINGQDGLPLFIGIVNSPK